MTAQEWISAGKPDEALIELQNEIRAKPEDPKLRIFLFQLHCALGNWPKALLQLQVIAGIDPDTTMLAQIFQPVINCEALRDGVFHGKLTPLIFGEPLEWVGLLVKASQHISRGEFAAAADLRNRAFEAAPSTPGTIDGKPFAWIADADSRLGPMLELIMEGKYYWVPFCRIRRIAMAAPTDLRDLVWVPAQIVWTNGGEASGHIPTRYSRSESSKDGAVRLARKTEWQEMPEETFIGSGQRILATDEGEHALLQCRLIDFAETAQ
ncbi:MAG TPA: type VI secretion system accessory protein TagJ [Candidatus Saccharimonadales bacterium]|nr:type VI secretion system accessory protein TagJ [Candidatus Saccharimonadales bacterium]